MEKFWHTCFKIAKVFLSLGIILVVLIGFLNGIAALFFTYKPVNETITYTEYKIFNPIGTKDEHSITETEMGQYKTIKKIINDLDFPMECYDVIINRLDEIELSDRDDFIANMQNYYQNTYDNFIKTTKELVPGATEKQIRYYMKLDKHYQNKIIPAYFESYKDQKEKIKAQKLEYNLKRNIYAGAFGICVVLFILMLLIPLLIKIEENTRK